MKKEIPKTPEGRDSLSFEFLKELGYLKQNIWYLNFLIETNSKQEFITTSIKGLKADLEDLLKWLKMMILLIC